jgi:peptidoglycan hydrolase CwlO-like protein
VHTGFFGEAPNYYLQGHFVYHAENYQQGPAIVAALLACQEGIADTLDKDTKMLSAKRKRLEDIQRELARPFEYENRLTALRTRQRELNQLLDIDKDEAGTGSMDSEEIRQAA